MPLQKNEINFLKEGARLRIHCVGIKGIGVSALAQILKSYGHTVTGSDISERFSADDALRSAGIRISSGFSKKHIKTSIDIVIVSNAYIGNAAKGNPEVLMAGKLGIPILSYPEALATIFNGHLGLAVAGSHGKSTTSALLAVTLEYLGANPSAVIGAVVKNWKSNARIPRNKKRSSAKADSYFVIEADEYRRAFHNYNPYGAIITSMDWDHPDTYKTEKEYKDSFKEFVNGVNDEGFLVVNGDEADIRSLVSRKSMAPRVLTYGYRVSNELRIGEMHQRKEGISVDLVFKKKRIGTFKASLYGRHNASNIASVVGTCLMLGYKPEAIRGAVRWFEGAVRRFDIQTPLPYKGKPIIIDDYAHHPAEIIATIKAARATYTKRRIRVLFQPHTFSRTKAYFDDFISTLKEADEVSLMATFGSAREVGGKGKSAKDLADALKTRYFANQQAAYRYYRLTLSAKDILIVMGAGDGNLLAAKLAEKR